MKPRPLPADPMIAQLVRQARATTMGRRALLAGAGGGAAALALAACSTGGATKPTAAPDESDSSKLVRWDNWALYIDVDDAGDYPTLDAFTAETGIKVEYTEAVDDNNTYYGKVKDQLALGQDIGADTVCLTDWMVGRWIRFGYTQELDQANIPNLKNLLPSLKDVGFDPGRKMSVPWQGGFAGICWNKEKLPNGIASVEDLWSSDLKGRVGVLSEMRDTMGLIMLDMGVDIAGDWGDDEFFAAIDVLEKQVGDGQVRNIKGNAYKEDLINEDTLAAIVWSGDIVQLNAENGDKWEFVVPDKGGTLWNDNFLVPIGSTHKKNVEKLIDYYYDPAVAAEVAAYVNYITPVAGAKEAAMAIDPELANNQLIFPDDTTLAKARVFRTLTGAEEQKYDAAFQGILLGS
ncbi:spermidine/putrescine ABC transporter substrate-binding protein [Cryobacterium sp. TMT2-17-1]|uniref:polyamine ABC transporter substrate-binding protein n=1 Tax=unclassified Cryobacterium TaxID=2649013 RepID=UPI001068E492|nr:MULTISPECIES: spermidine/putrescine ABC transporter substrate-binding protein [unclassified Cryobacterium]TFB57306.1 spermidine/putrescine ABC transporter substrate-binding protein [Cryobacterium sp. Sr3]TFC24886.1 spermidine/putrescine ABC transporter substrate-binding protein [Cryobacterium sp. TMT2-18-2]TFC38643.1 spermidine/putrescine ABC transporter substrate-binding protein [Cryobacterium sp. TMT2-42-4]TFC51345.1 spermidine/putrescine ABC transporter substrate-binding protein [Cryobact